jgi:hypothetical protein
MASSGTKKVMSGRPVTPRQLEVLRWVANGCPQDAWSDDTHKHSARALEARGLVAVSRHQGIWHAVLRPAGQHYLDHGCYPGAPTAATASPRAAPERPQPHPALPSEPAAPAADEVSAMPRPARQLPATSPTESLISQIRAAGDRLTIEPATDSERTSLDTQIRAIRRFGKLPPGLQLLVEQPSWSQRVLTIAPLPGWMAAEPALVPVPAQLRNPHPAVAALRDSDRFRVTGPPRSRALRLLQALAAVAAGRGHAVFFPHSRADQYGPQERDPCHLRFALHGHEIGVRVVQPSDRSEHVPTAKELADQHRYSWTHIPKYDYAPSARLKFELPGRHEYQQSSWADGARSCIEDKLPEIFRELEFRADAAARQRRADEERRRREELEEQRRIARATIKLIQAHRADVLKAQLTAWQHARQLDNYLTAMHTRITQIEDQETAAAAREWLAWARAHTAGLDPLNGTLAMPPDPEPTHAALAPFLERRSGPW